MEQFTDLIFNFQGVQTLLLEIAVRMDGSTFSHFLIFTCNSRAKFAIEVGPDTDFRAGKMKKKLLYETPVVEVLDARVEKGFAGSGNGTGNNTGTQPIGDGNQYFV